MGAEELAVDLNKIIFEICNQLLNKHKLITTKNVISMLTELFPDKFEYTEELINQNINIWRVMRIDEQNINSRDNNKITYVDKSETTSEYTKALQINIKYKTQLLHAKRELQFLKAKIQALNSFYNRQRKELIMKIEGILYKKN